MVMVLCGARVTFTDLACVTVALTFANTRRFYKQLRSEGSVLDVTIHHPRVFSLDWTDLTGVQTMLEQAAPVDSPGARPTARPLPLPLGVVAEEEDFAATATATSVTTDKDAEPHASASKGTDAGAAPAPAWVPLSVPFDVVLLTDCVFSVHLVPDLVRTIRQCTGPRSVVYCVHEIRDTDANAEFLRVLGLSFKLKIIDSKKQHPDYRHELVQIVVAKPRRR